MRHSTRPTHADGYRKSRGCNLISIDWLLAAPEAAEEVNN